MVLNYRLRPADADDLGFLTEMLVAAVNWRPGRQHRREVLSDPAVARYLSGWPRPGDSGVVAIAPDDRPIGAAWLRYFDAAEPGYGFVAPDVPELSLAVVESWRGQGVGRALLRRIHELATGTTRISLSVERENPAGRLYASEGFLSVGSRSGDSETMVKVLGAHSRGS